MEMQKLQEENKMWTGTYALLVNLDMFSIH